ncbi:MAG TPA: hypothetical protein VF195_09980 [Actinomycetota bacterium]
MKEATRLDPVQADIADWNREIADAAAGKNIAHPPVDVDAFVLETKQVMVEENRAEAKQAALGGTVGRQRGPRSRARPG